MNTQETQNTTLVVYPGNVTNNVLNPLSLAGAFAVRTSLALTYKAFYVLFPSEPENGYPTGYRTFHHVELIAVVPTLQFQGTEYYHPDVLANLPQEIIDALEEYCAEQAIDNMSA
jgi:hypothetical protein